VSHKHRQFLLAELLSTGLKVVEQLGLSMPADFSTDSAIRAQLWHLRKGIIPAVGGTRPQGTNALLEDIVVPVPALARTCMELIRLFDKYNYRNCMIFGHAKDGNVHFMLTEDFSNTGALDRFSAFTEAWTVMLL